MTSDALQPLFERFRLHAQTFFTGNLCAVASFDQPKDHGHLHLVRSGRGEIRYLGGRKALKINGSGLLFYPRNLPHHLVPDGPEGLDLVCATITFGGIGGACPLAGLPRSCTWAWSRLGRWRS
ncbi:MAG: cupin domain-containing protein [Holophagaceae bacterium]|nr:cupin domain-containing protein [Holophagaceae bacterium]